MLEKTFESVRPNPRPRQFRLISLFGLMVLACIPLTWLALQARQSRQRAAAEQRFSELGGRVESYFAWPTTIDLDHAKVKDEDLAMLGEFSSVEYLYLGGTTITDAGMAHVAALSNLGWLDLRDTPVTDAGLEHLTGLKKLRMLRIEGSHITPEGVERLKRSIPEVECEFWK